MKNVLKALAIVCLMTSCETKTNAPAMDYHRAKSAINQSIDAWDKAWENKDVELSLKYYADSIDWTNAFGDRVRTKDELRALLENIFGLDFVMAGENNYGENEITFLSDSIATVRSLNIRKNQKWPNGSPMDDRHIHHLRVFKNIHGEWLIVNHLVGQAWQKNPQADTLAIED
ncbi:MAG: nuclear transport factor 2 family protein [Flavobacteriaceae bacterium]|nr:nuclear transport factor 2 family protein [Flavobacteriaceae bacterium]